MVQKNITIIVSTNKQLTFKLNLLIIRWQIAALFGIFRAIKIKINRKKSNFLPSCFCQLESLHPKYSIYSIMKKQCSTMNDNDQK